VAEAVKKLSPEIKDLLNRIFVIDAGKRVTIQQIKRHPWYNKPLPPGYQEMWDKLKAKQEKLDKWYKEHPPGDNAAMLAMNQEIERMVEQSTKVYDPEDPGERGGGDGDGCWMIDLRDKQVCIETLTRASCAHLLIYSCIVRSFTPLRTRASCAHLTPSHPHTLTHSTPPHVFNASFPSLFCKPLPSDSFCPVNS